MKKAIALALAAILTLYLAACGNGRQPDETQTTASVPTTATATTTTQEFTADPSWQHEFLLYQVDFPCNWCLFPSVVGMATVMFDGSPEHLVELLAKRGTLPQSSQVLSANFDNDTITLDMNEDFVTGLFFSGDGKRGGPARLSVFINAMLSAYDDFEQIIITAEGQTFEDGHRVYDEPFKFITFTPIHSIENCPIPRPD